MRFFRKKKKPEPKKPEPGCHHDHMFKEGMSMIRITCHACSHEEETWVHIEWRGHKEINGRRVGIWKLKDFYCKKCLRTINQISDECQEEGHYVRLQ